MKQLWASGMPRWLTSVRPSASIPAASMSNLLGLALTRLRRYPEAREIFDRCLALAPTNLSCIGGKVTAFLAGDLAGAGVVIKTASKQIEPTVLVAGMAQWDLMWVLDESQRDLVLRLTPSAFRNDKMDWGLTLAQTSALKGDAAGVRTYAEEARRDLEERLRAAPENKSLRVYLGVALSYLGRKDEAIREENAGSRTGRDGRAMRTATPASRTRLRGSTYASAKRRKRSTD